MEQRKKMTIKPEGKQIDIKNKRPGDLKDRIKEWLLENQNQFFDDLKNLEPEERLLLKQEFNSLFPKSLIIKENVVLNK